jgi:surface protein
MKRLLFLLLVTIAVLLPTKLWAADGVSEPYAVMSDNNTVLTFYYDDQREARGGTLISQDGYPTWGSYEQVVESVVFDPAFANCTSITSTVNWFFNFVNLKSITGLQYLNTANVTDMNSMFAGCSSLTSLDLSNFNTSNVTNMFGLFRNCSGLTSLDLSNFNTENVTDMSAMFLSCSNLSSLNISSFNTSKVGNMESMFYTCSSLTNLDLSHFNTANVTSMRQMFQGCTGLTSLNVSNFNTENVGNMYFMFEGCSNLIELDLGSFITTNVSDMKNMFAGCSSLTSLNVSSFSTPSLTDMTEIFSGCSSLRSLDVRGFNTSNVTSMYGIFSNCSSLTSLDVSNFNTQNVTNMSGVFSGCSNLTNLDVKNFNTEKVVGMGSMFNGCSALTSLDVSNFKTDNVANMIDMFAGCSNLTSLDVSAFNTENLTNMYEMFRGCSNLSSLDLSGFKTDKVTHMTNMFDGCSNLKTIYAGSGWSTANVSYGTNVFRDCISLVGSAGTVYDVNHVDYTFAHIDGGTANPGYFTDKNAARRKLVLPTPVISHEGNRLTITVPSMGSSYTDLTDKVNVEPTAWGGTAPVVNLAGEWTCSVLDDDGNVSETYVVTLRENGKAEFPTTYLEESAWSYRNGELSIRHDILYSNDGYGSYQYAIYTLTTTTPENPIEFTGVRRNTVGNSITENNSERNVRFTYNGSSISAGSVVMNNGKQVAYAIADEGSSEKTGELLSQTISGIANGYYTIELYAKSVVSSGQQIANDVAYLFANDAKLFIPLATEKTMTDDDVYQIGVQVTDETLRLGLGKEKTGANWHALQIKSLTHCPLVADQTMEGAIVYYTTDDSDPSAASTRYTGAFTVNRNCTVKAIATANGYTNSQATSLAVDWIVNAMFDGLVLTVGGELTMAEALETVGGRDAVFPTLAAIVWNNNDVPLAGDDLNGLNNPNLLVYVNWDLMQPAGVQNVVINGQAREIVLTDATSGNNNFYVPQTFTAERISYTRNFTQTTQVGVSRGWESIALPFNVQRITHETKGAIAPFGNNTSNRHFWLRRLGSNGLQPATGIEANTPYVISMPNSSDYTADYNLAGRVTFAAENATIPVTEVKTAEMADQSIVMVPTMLRQERSSEVWALNVGEVRGRYLEGSVFERDYREVRPFEAYTVHRQENSNPAPRYVPVLEIGGTTGIYEMEEVRSKTDDVWYTTDGRKLQGKPTAKGVYINNGQKIVIR